MPQLFGTDGVRGVANADLTPELALRLGRVGAYWLAEAGRATGDSGTAATPTVTPGTAAARVAAGRPGRPFVVLGRDSRLSGDLLASAVVAGCCSVGVDVVDLGILPTPGVAHLCAALGALGGVMISASHNPVDDNGVKFFDAQGYKLTEEAEAGLETLLRAKQDRLPRPTGAGVGARLDGQAYLEAYADHLVAAAGGDGAISPRAPDRSGLLVVVDAGYGATAALATRVLERAGARVVALHDVFDGNRINVACGSTHPAEAARLVRERGAAAGVAFDGDGDRCIAIDEKGQIVDGDQIMAVLALDLIARKALPRKTVVATVMSNLGLDLALREVGGKVVRTPVGDRNVLHQMRELGAVLGGEQSGHVLLLKHATTGDGLLTALSLLAVLARTGKPLSELAAGMTKLPQVLVNVAVQRKDKLATSEKVATAIERVREALGHTGSVLVRPSGTEALVRIMIEGRDAARIKEMAMGLAGVVAAELGGEIVRGEPKA